MNKVILLVFCHLVGIMFYKMILLQRPKEVIGIICSYIVRCIVYHFILPLD